MQAPTKRVHSLVKWLSLSYVIYVCFKYCVLYSTRYAICTYLIFTKADIRNKRSLIYEHTLKDDYQKKMLTEMMFAALVKLTKISYLHKSTR